MTWDQFLKEIDPEKQQTLSQTQISQTLVIIGKTSFTIEDYKQTMDTNDLEIILVFSTPEIILNIEEILPMDVFYIPKHRSIVNKKRKSIRYEQRKTLFLANSSFQLLWKYS